MIAFMKSEKSRDLGLLLIRAILGFTMFYHGAQKFGIIGNGGIDGFVGALTKMDFPLPTLNAYLAAGAELLGGILIIAGAVFRPAAILVAITMFVAVFAVHFKNGFSGQGGYEYPLNLALVALALAFIGPGRLALKTPLDC